jgi:hypothetical protein
MTRKAIKKVDRRKASEGFLTAFGMTGGGYAQAKPMATASDWAGKQRKKYEGFTHYVRNDDWEARLGTLHAAKADNSREEMGINKKVGLRGRLYMRTT